MNPQYMVVQNPVSFGWAAEYSQISQVHDRHVGEVTKNTW